jgi:hypothetical protein
MEANLAVLLGVLANPLASGPAGGGSPLLAAAAVAWAALSIALQHRGALRAALALADRFLGRRDPRDASRTIVARVTRSQWHRDKRDNNSWVLQKAVAFHARNRGYFDRLRNGSISLEGLDGDRRALGERGAWEDDEDAPAASPSLASRPSNLMTLKPAQGDRVLVSERPWPPGSGRVGRVYLSLKELRASSGDHATEELSEMRLTGRSDEDPAGLVDAFVQEAYESYKRDIQREVEGERRFLFSLAEGKRRPGAGPPVFTRHAFSGSRGLDTVYHPDVPRVERLVSDFLAKSGKFAVRGHPHRLGFLLHGPPGTGKTTLIRALAARTDRHVVSVPLDKVSSNSELEQIMWGETYPAPGGDVGIRVPNDRAIFVLEDVDAAGDAVLRRGSGGAAETSSAAASAAAAASLASVVALARGDSSGPGGRCRRACGGDPYREDDECDSDSGYPGPPGAVAAAAGRPPGGRLTLSGVLNVLDGLVETPGRIVVMTTNRPEALDPALVRPGRVSISIRMGDITPADAARMAERYFPEATPAEREELRAWVSAEPPTPAKLESLFGEFDTIGECIAGGRAAAPGKKSPDM